MTLARLNEALAPVESALGWICAGVMLVLTAAATGYWLAWLVLS